MNIKFFFFTLFQNFMVPLDSSWWDLFKSALAPKYTICPQVCFGTYLWIFFIFTSVPILKKSCCRKNQIFAQNHLPFLRPSPLSSLPIVFDDGEWINFCLFLVYYYCLWWENITLYKTCRKKQDCCIKSTNYKYFVRNVVASIVRTIVEMRNEELRW